MKITDRKNGEFCPECDQGKLKRVKRNFGKDYKGFERKIINVFILKCPECEKQFWTRSMWLIVKKLLDTSNKRIEKILNTSEEPMPRLRVVSQYLPTP